MSKDNPAAPGASQTLDDAFRSSQEAKLLAQIVIQNHSIIQLLQKIVKQGEDDDR